MTQTHLDLYNLWTKHAERKPRKRSATVAAHSAPGHGHVALVEVRDDLPNGRGLAVTRDVKAGQTILTLPSTLLLNVKTIARCWKQEAAEQILPTPRRPSSSSTSLLPLTSMQAISLLLVSCQMAAAARPASPRNEALEELMSFHASLPASFASHPVMWMLERQEIDSGGVARRRSAALLDALPPDALANLTAEYEKCRSDWLVIKAVFEDSPHLLPRFVLPPPPPPTLRQYTHAWLSINSRSVYFNLALPSHNDNFTLVPLLDMANHTSDAGRICQVLPTNSVGNAILPRGVGAAAAGPSSGLEMRAPPDGLAAGDEVLIQYGARDDATLLVEYGFHLSTRFINESAEWQGNPYAAVKLDPYIMAHLDVNPHRTLIQETLRQHHFWEDWTIHPEPGSTGAHASWSTQCALRLVVALSSDENSDVDGILRRWRLTVDGALPYISAENESAVEELLRVFCQRVVEDGQRRLDKFRSDMADVDEGDDADWRFSRLLVVSLLQSQVEIARRVVEQGGAR